MNEKNEKNKQFFLIEITPSWKSGKSYDLVKINQNEFKLYDHNFWLWNMIYPSLRHYLFVAKDSFNDNLRRVFRVIESNEKKIIDDLNHLLKRRD